MNDFALGLIVICLIGPAINLLFFNTSFTVRVFIFITRSRSRVEVPRNFPLRSRKTSAVSRQMSFGPRKPHTLSRYSLQFSK